MWPFNFNKPIRYESRPQLEFERALERTRSLISMLHEGRAVPDAEIRDVYFALANRTQSNCDAVATGLLATIGSLCAHAQHLAGEFLPSAMQAVYYLGIEDFEGVRSYILHVAKQEKTYLDTHTQPGSNFLERLADEEALIVEAFRKMYDAEDNTWRIEDPDVPNTPSILRR